MAAKGALETLYRQHAQAVFRFAYGLCRSRAEAEDIVSETFARLATRAHAIKDVTARAYLLTVARNIFLDTKRKSARDARALAEMEHDAPDTAEQPDDRERLAKALKALGALPEGERAALLLRLDHGMSYEEIAVALNISLAAAKVRVHRARLRLASAHTIGDDNES